MNRRAGWDLHSCFVLHSRPYSNTSLLIEFFSECEGRIPAIAKGARSGHSRLRGILQPFGRLLASFAGRGEVSTLISAEAGGDPVRLSGEALYCGFYLNELLMRLVQRGDPHDGLFTDYRQALAGLTSGKDRERCLRRFEIVLLDRLGYGLCLDRDADTGEPIRPDRYYHYEIEKGVVMQAGESQSDTHLQGKTLLGLARDYPLDRVEQRQARHLMRRILSHYLGQQPLKSRELFRPVGSARYERSK